MPVIKAGIAAVPAILAFAFFNFVLWAGKWPTVFLTGLIAAIVLWRFGVGLPEDVTGLPARPIGLAAVIMGRCFYCP